MSYDFLKLGRGEDLNKKDKKEQDINNKKKMSKSDSINNSVKCFKDIKKKDKEKKRGLNQVNQTLKLIHIMRVYKHIKPLKIALSPATLTLQLFLVSVIHQKHPHKKT